MEDLWKHPMGRPGAQHQLATFSSQDVNQYNQQQQQQSPFLGQELSVTIRQETAMGSNLINFGLQQAAASHNKAAVPRTDHPHLSPLEEARRDLSQQEQQQHQHFVHPFAAAWPSSDRSSSPFSEPNLFKPNLNYQRLAANQRIQNFQAPKRAMQVQQQSGTFNSTPSQIFPLRVYTISPTGRTVCGDLHLSNHGRLEVVCSCHNYPMPVSKFVQHAGYHSEQPANAIFLENGVDTLVQWRKAFFLQLGYQVPDDDVGWDWNDDVPASIKHHKAEPDIIDLTRTRQVWEGHAMPVVQPSQDFHNAYSSGMYGSQDARQQQPKGPSSIQAENLSQVVIANNFRPVGSTTNLRPPASTTSEFDFINNRTYCSSLDQQPGMRDKTGDNGKDNLVSSFELRLGQPSQTAATSLASTLRSHIHHSGIEYRKALDATSLQTSSGYGLSHNFHGLASYIGDQQKWNIEQFGERAKTWTEFAAPLRKTHQHPANDQDVSFITARQFKTQEPVQPSQLKHQNGRYCNDAVGMDMTFAYGTSAQHGSSQFTWVQRDSWGIPGNKEQERVAGPGDRLIEASKSEKTGFLCAATPEPTPVVLEQSALTISTDQELVIVKTKSSHQVVNRFGEEEPCENEQTPPGVGQQQKNTYSLLSIGESQTADEHTRWKVETEGGLISAPPGNSELKEGEANLPKEVESGVCSKSSSGNDAAEVIKEDNAAVSECGSKKHDAIDESSGIGKCSSSELDKKLDSGKFSEGIDSEIGTKQPSRSGGRKKKPLKWKRLNAELATRDSEGFKCNSGVTESHATDEDGHQVSNDGDHHDDGDRSSADFQKLSGGSQPSTGNDKRTRVKTRQLSAREKTDQVAVNVEISDRIPKRRPSIIGATKMVSLKSIMKQQLPSDPQRTTRRLPEQTRRTVNSTGEDDEYIPRGTRKRKLSKLEDIPVSRRPLELRRPPLTRKPAFKVWPGNVPRGERTPREVTKKPNKMWLRSKAMHLDCVPTSSHSDDGCNEEVVHPIKKFIPRRKRQTEEIRAATHDVKGQPRKRRQANDDRSMHLVNSTFYSGPPVEHCLKYSTPAVDGCCVCASSVTEPSNQLVCCCQCPVKVHQACYGLPKAPKGSWACRACKSNVSNIVCVLCGYGGGAMTHAQKTEGAVKGLLKAWSVAKRAKSDSSIQLRCSSRSGGPQNSCSGEVVRNTITATVRDPNVTQWMHMVCALWMPGTRCLNFSTMGMFDVSGVSVARTRLVCSICNRQGGSCIQCQETNCAVPFHAWCAHTKGLLQIETVNDSDGHLRFQGTCSDHLKGVKQTSKIKPELPHQGRARRDS